MLQQSSSRNSQEVPRASTAGGTGLIPGSLIRELRPKTPACRAVQPKKQKQKQTNKTQSISSDVCKRLYYWAIVPSLAQIKLFSIPIIDCLLIISMDSFFFILSSIVYFFFTHTHCIFFNKFIYLFIYYYYFFGCVGSLLLHVGFL